MSIASSIYPLRPGIGAAVFSALCLTISGCCGDHDSAVCGGKVTDAISSFIVTTQTGSDQSDANIKLCVRTKTAAPERCEPLDTAANNFEEDAVETFDVAISVSAGDFDSFTIENSGGAFFGNNEWEVAALKVSAVLASGGQVTLYDEPDIGCNNDVESNQRYYPMECTY